MPTLSKRLSLIASLVPYGARVCDIGTDHGYLAIELIKSGAALTVIASDIGEKPLENARKNIELCGVQGIDLRLGDGLSCISPNEADTVIIAGMGGEVIADILKKSREITQNKNTTVILQPTTSPEALREFLYRNGYSIEKEIPLCENDKLYSVLLVKYKGEEYAFKSFECYIGSVTPETQDGLLYIKKQQQRCFKCMTALEKIPHKHTEFLHYKEVFDEICEYLKMFGE